MQSNYILLTVPACAASFRVTVKRANQRWNDCLVRARWKRPVCRRMLTLAARKDKLIHDNGSVWISFCSWARCMCVLALNYYTYIACASKKASNAGPRGCLLALGRWLVEASTASHPCSAQLR